MDSKTRDTRAPAGNREKQVHHHGPEKQFLLNAREMAVSLGNFQSSLNEIDNVGMILKTTAAKVREIISFKVVSFYLVNEQDSSFYQACCHPEDASQFIEKEVNVLINDKTFALALRVNKPTIITSADRSEQIMLHPLLTSSRTRGMFLGVLAQDRQDIDDISLILFTTAIVTTAHALESFGHYQHVKDINKELEASIIKLEKSEQELTKANLQLQRDIFNRKQAEESLFKSEQNYRLMASYYEQLNNISIAFTESFSMEDLFDKIAESLRLLTGAITATFAVYDAATRNLKPVSMSVNPTAQDTIKSVFGTALREISMPIDEAQATQMLHQFIRRPKDLYELSAEAVPREISDAMMDAIGCTQLIALAISYADELLGTCVAYLPEGRPAVPDDALKTFAYLSGMVVKRKRAEETLKENEKTFRLLTEKMTDIVWITDMNLQTVYVTPSVKTILGFTQEERMRQTVDQQLTPDSLSYGLDAMLKEFALEEKGQGDPDRSASLVLEYYHKDGSTRWMETIISGLRNDQGVLMGLHGVSRDVTEQKLAQEKLRESQELYTKLVDALPDVIVRTDLEGKILFINDYAFQINGYRRDEIEGQNILQYIAPEDQEAAFQNMARMLEGKVVPHEYNLVTKNGDKIPFEMNGSVLRNADGTPTGVVVVGRNISERKRTESIIRKSEERYRAIFESTATANIIMAEDTTILMANDNFAAQCGYTKQELEGKMSWTVFIHKDDLEKMKTYHRMRRIDPRSVPPAYEFRFINRKGEVKDFFISVAVIPGTTETIASLVDLTERKQLETQLIQSQKMESVGRLAGGVAHDFNNMLSVIIGNTEMAMKRVKPSEPLYKSLQDVLSAGLRSSDLTRQLLAFARKQTVSPKVLDLNDMVAGMLKMLQRLIGEDINLGWHPGRKLWKVKIDPSQIDQLLANLIVNARDAITKTGRIDIETSNITCDEVYCMDRSECVPGDYVVLAVSDNGFGMDKETQANIFEPFFTTKKEGQGTGLGLATVYGIVKQNSGFVNVYSELEQGSTFKIYLPRYLDEPEEATDDESEPELQGGTETVMLVEDSETVLKLCKAMLETLGYKVLAANGKDQALRLAGEYSGEIDLLLTDVVMPDMNGKELSERITAMKPGLKRLYMSGYTADVIARQGILDEGINFISKPFSLKDLAAKIREVLGQ